MTRSTLSKVLFTSLAFTAPVWMSGCHLSYDTYTIVDSNGEPIEGVYVRPQRLRYNPLPKSNEEGRVRDSQKKENGDKITLDKDGYGYAVVVKNDQDIYYLPKNSHLCPGSQDIHDYYLSLAEDWAEKNGQLVGHVIWRKDTTFERGTVLDAWSGDYWIPYGHESFSSSTNRKLESKQEISSDTSGPK